MSPFLIIVVAIGAVSLAVNLVHGASDWVMRPFRRWFHRQLDVRVARLRAEARREGREEGSLPLANARWAAGAIDVAWSTVVSVVLTLGFGLSDVTEISTVNGSTHSHLEEHFSFPLFVLLALLAYCGWAWLAGRTTRGQTLGQELWDYAPRRVDGAPLTSADSLKRSLLRLAAAPPALVARLQGREPTFEHDAWANTTVGILGGMPRAPDAAVSAVPESTSDDERSTMDAQTHDGAAARRSAVPVPSERAFVCSECAKAFSSYNAATRHALRDHVVDGATTVKIIETVRGP